MRSTDNLRPERNTSPRNTSEVTQNGGIIPDSPKRLPVKDNGRNDFGAYPAASQDKEFSRFQDRLRQGKIKLCGGCGGVMTKSSRMILSAPAGLALIIIGTLHMVLYGLATNFYQPPWFIKFVLPAGYYVGSIFIGVGVLFFFIRERIWLCKRCREMAKR